MAEQISRRQALSGIGGLAALALTGCQTANYKGNGALSKERLNYLQERAGNPTSPSEPGKTNVSYDEALEVSQRFHGQLPNVRLNLYSLDSNGELQHQFLNTYAPENTQQNVRALQTLLGYTPEKSQGAARIVLGSPDSNNVFSRTGENQFTRSSGLLGVHYVSESGRDGILVEASEVKSPIPKIKKEYEIKITPGVEESSLSLRRTDLVTLTDSARDALIAGAVAGPEAMPIPLVFHGVDSIGSYFEARGKVPQGTSFSRTRNITSGFDEQAAHIISTLDSAKSLGARALTIADTPNGALYVPSVNPRGVEISDNSIILRTSFEGASYLMATLAQGAKVAAAAGLYESIKDTETKTRTKNKQPESPESGGGVIDIGPGLGNPENSGGGANFGGGLQ